MSDPEFYVGYLPKAPKGIARRVRALVVFLFFVAAVGAIGFAAVQRTYAPSAFEYGKGRTFQGTLQARPFPTLLVRRPGSPVGRPQYSRYLLVAGGKHADSQAAGFNGKSVRLRGTLIYRDDQTMLEMIPGSVSKTGQSAFAIERGGNLGRVEVTGEIVDSKCNFGVMNPGQGKVHRDCAVRCLSGGIPPAFVTNDLFGASATLLLTGPGGEPLKKETFLSIAGQPVRVRGSVVKAGDTLFLEADPASLEPVR